MGVEMCFRTKIIIFVCFSLGTKVSAEGLKRERLRDDFEATSFPASDLMTVSAGDDEPVLLKLNELLAGMEILKKSVNRPEAKPERIEEPCFRLPNTTSNSSSFFVPLLREFQLWLKTNNSSSNKLNAMLVEVLTDEHEKLIQEVKRIQAKTDLEGLEDIKASMLQLKALSRNISAEKSDFISRLDNFDKQLESTYRKIGCSSKTVSVVNGKFCRNGKWFFPVGAYIGSLDALVLTNFRFTRLRLFGQMWNLKNADGNVAIFRLQDITVDQDTIKHLNDVMEIAESIGMLVLVDLYVQNNTLGDLFKMFELVSESPALFGFNVRVDSTLDLSTTLASLSNIRKKHPLLLFTASFTCRRAEYREMLNCVKVCATQLEMCINECDPNLKAYQMALRRGYHRQPLKPTVVCDYSVVEASKENIDISLDFVIARELQSDVAIADLAKIVNIPVVFQGIQPGLMIEKEGAVGFFLDDEPVDDSKSIAVIRDVKSRINSISYEGSTVN